MGHLPPFWTPVATAGVYVIGSWVLWPAASRSDSSRPSWAKTAAAGLDAGLAAQGLATAFRLASVVGQATPLHAFWLPVAHSSVLERAMNLYVLFRMSQLLDSGRSALLGQPWSPFHVGHHAAMVVTAACFRAWPVPVLLGVALTNTVDNVLLHATRVAVHLGIASRTSAMRVRAWWSAQELSLGYCQFALFIGAMAISAAQRVRPSFSSYCLLGAPVLVAGAVHGIIGNQLVPRRQRAAGVCDQRAETIFTTLWLPDAAAAWLPVCATLLLSKGAAARVGWQETPVTLLHAITSSVIGRLLLLASRQATLQ